MMGAKVLSAVMAPDWITATADGSIDRRLMRDLATRYLGLAVRTHKWNLRGYYGRATSEIPTLDGGLAYGENLAEERSILQTWGSLTQRMLTELMALHAGRWTRCDLAVTVLFDRPLDHVSAWPRETPKRKINLSWIAGNGPGGGTLYVGKRGSEQFGRIYDKGDQLGTIPPRTYWRFEVEYKRGSAEDVVDSLLSLTDPLDRGVWIARQVGRWFDLRGLQSPQITDEVFQYPLVRYGSRLTTDQTTIQWLSSTVRPALLRLDRTGALQKAFDALGVDAGCLMPEGEADQLIRGVQQSTFLDKMQDPGYTSASTVSA
jgi:hypothetical protein